MSVFFLHFRSIFFCVVSGIILLELLAVLHTSSVSLFTYLISGALLLVTVIRPFWGVWGLVSIFPFLSGYYFLTGVDETSIVYSAVYFVWFFHYLRKNKKYDFQTPTSFIGYLFAILIILNLCLVALRIVEWPVPSRYWFEWMSSFPFAGQSDPLWQINAALILLKGIVLFQIVELEITGNRHWHLFSRVVYGQAICIAGFASFQLIHFKKNSIDFLGLTLPFSDVHSYGSAIILLFFIFFVSFLKRFCKGNIFQEKTYGACESRSVMLINGIFAFLFFCFCLYSSSRVTWVVLIVLLLVVFAKNVRNRKTVVYGVALLFAVFWVGNILSPVLLKSENPSLWRLGSILNVQNITKDGALSVRYELWKRSLKMIGEYPLTGVGIGNVYRNIHSYKNRSVGQWDNENSHNYYLQIAAELGVPALLVFLSLLVSLFLPVRNDRNGKGSSLEQKMYLRPFQYGLCAYLLTMLTGHPLLLVSQQFLFWPVVAIISKGQWLLEERGNDPRFGSTVLKILGILSILLYIFGLGLNLSKNEPWTIPKTYGFYSKENWDGVDMRWISGKAQYYIPAERQNLTLKVVAQSFNSTRPDGLRVKIFSDDILVGNLHFLEEGSKILSFPLISDDGKDIKVSFEVDRVFKPKELGVNEDPRLLGVAIGEMDKLDTSPSVYILLMRSSYGSAKKDQ